MMVQNLKELNVKYKFICMIFSRTNRASIRLRYLGDGVDRELCHCAAFPNSTKTLGHYFHARLRPNAGLSRNGTS